MPKQISKNEHIFPATQLTELALRWKDLNARHRHKQAMLVLDEIIRKSTEMFERFAQYENFHRTVELPDLVAAAQEKVVKWLIKWKPRKGKLFSWFSKCSKNAFRSEVMREVNLRKKLHVTGDNLEKFHGVESHEVDRHDVEKSILTSIEQITCRWGDPQELGALRYLIECVLDHESHDRAAAIKGASYAWGISLDMSKFFYNWALSALREALYERTRVPFTDQDLFIQYYSKTQLPDLLNIITWDQMVKIIAIHGGTRTKWPTVAHLAQIRENYETHREIRASDQDPDAVVTVAKKRKRTPRSAQDAYDEMVETLNPNRAGEHYIYPRGYGDGVSNFMDD